MQKAPKSMAADLYMPKDAQGKLPAIAVSGPFGAVKEQSSGLYAQAMAERGFLTIAFDPSFTGESGGMPRYVASPESIPKTFRRPLIFCPYTSRLIQKRLALSVFADGEEWH